MQRHKPIIISVTFFAGIMLIALFISSCANPLPDKVNSWNKIVPGKTTKAEVIRKLGRPEGNRKETFGAVLLYKSGIKALPNMVIYDSATNKVIGTLLTVSEEGAAKKYYQEMQSAGMPEKVMYSTYLQFSKIYIFASKGVTYSANEYTKMVDGIHCFSSTTLDNYLSQYGKFFNETDPHQF